MNEIFTVWASAEFFRDEDGTVRELPEDSKTWIDSYWTNEEDAIAEAERLWAEDGYDEFLIELRVFGRKLNVRGKGENSWNSARDRVVKCWRSTQC